MPRPRGPRGRTTPKPPTGGGGGGGGNKILGEEDGDLTEYSGDTGSFSVVQPSGFSTKDGTYVVRADATSAFVGIDSTTGLDNYPEAGDTFRGWVRTESTGGEAIFIFAQQSEGSISKYDDGYWIRPRFDKDEFRFGVASGGGLTTIASDTNLSSLGPDTWYKIEVQWGSGGTFTVTLFDNSGTQKTQISGSDTTYTSGGIQLFNNGDDSSAVCYWDDWRIV